MTTLRIITGPQRRKYREGDVRRLKTKTLIRSQQRTREGHRMVSSRGPRWEWVSPEEYIRRNGRLPDELLSNTEVTGPKGPV